MAPEKSGSTTFVSPRLPTPVDLEGSLVPAYGGVRLHNQKGISPSRPDTRHDNPEQSVPLFQLRAIVLSLEHDELLTEGKVLSRQICDDIELSRKPSTAVFDNFDHH